MLSVFLLDKLRMFVASKAIHSANPLILMNILHTKRITWYLVGEFCGLFYLIPYRSTFWCTKFLRRYSALLSAVSCDTNTEQREV